MSQPDQNIFILIFRQILINAADRNEVSGRKKAKQALEDTGKGKTRNLLTESANKYHLAHALRSLAKNINKDEINTILEKFSA